MVRLNSVNLIIKESELKMSIIQTADINIPSDPATIKKIKDALFEISAAMTRAESEKLFQKEAIIALAEETDIPKKYLTRIAKIFHKQNRDLIGAENESTGELYDRIFVQEDVHASENEDFVELLEE